MLKRGVTILKAKNNGAWKKRKIDLKLKKIHRCIKNWTKKISTGDRNKKCQKSIVSNVLEGTIFQFNAVLCQYEKDLQIESQKY